MTFSAGTYGIDSARSVDSRVAEQSGSRFQVRYSAGAASSPSNPSYGLNAGKLCQQGEIASVLASGQDFLANDEWYEARTYEGANAAAQDAPVTLEFWQSRGLAKGATIMLNLDTYPNMGRLLDLQNYIDETNRRWNGYYVADGFYAGVPVLVALSKSGHIKHGWIPEGASWSTPDSPLDPSYAPPANSAWDLWFPTKSQIGPATKWLVDKLSGSSLVSCIWQNGNKWFNGVADENIVIIPGNLGTHLEAKGGQVTPTPPRPTPTPPQPVHRSPYHGAPWPGPRLHFGPSDHFGLISGPGTSHGGYYAAEQPYVKMIQQQLIWAGFVPGITNVNSSWADGKFEQPTVDAVTRFQRKYRARNTSLWGQVWSDDWATLFNL